MSVSSSSIISDSTILLHLSLAVSAASAFASQPLASESRKRACATCTTALCLASLSTTPLFLPAETERKKNLLPMAFSSSQRHPAFGSSVGLSRVISKA